MLKLLAKVLKGLNSDSNPWSIAIAIGLGMIVGLTPFWSFHNLLIVVVAFLFRTHLASFWLSVAAFSILAVALAPLMNGFGNQLLGNPALHNLWTSLYQQDFWRLTQFNNSLLLGSFLLSLAAAIPVTLLGYWLVVRYRTQVMHRIQKVKLVQWLRATKIVSLYLQLQDRG